MIEDQILGEYDRALAGSGEPRVSEVTAAPALEGRQPEREVATIKTEEEQESAEGKTLEEVAEMHLKDSFWNS